jgi:glycosyltransferase involved in cell wall biosynthesis
MTSKLIYILPEASEKTHMKYNVEFITALAKEKGVDIFLILERGNNNLAEIKASTGVKHIYYTGTNVFTRIPKLIAYLLLANLKGYRKVYVHYSFIGASLASLNPFFTTYYWNCGIPWQYKRPFLQELYESLTYKLISHFVTGANILTEQYSDFYKFNNNKSVVIPNWIDVAKTLEIKNQTDVTSIKKELNIADTDTVLFFNQRLATRKGANHILPILKSTSDHVKMIITNDGPYKEQLLKELKENNLESRVRVLGRVTNEKVIQLMTISDIYILTSEEEGMSHSLMEAFASGIPAISFAVGGTLDMYPEMYRDYCVEEKNIEKYIDKLNDLLSDKNKQILLGQALFEQVKSYDKEIVLNSFLEKVLND